MSTKYKFRDQDKLYFLSFTTVYWLDIFIRNEYRDLVLDSIRYNQVNKGLEVYGWCIMSSHIHMIIGSQGEKMETIMQGIKSVTSRNLREAIKNNNAESRRDWLLWMMERAGKLNKHNGSLQLWQEGNHPIELFDNKIMKQKLEYIHNNSVVSGFVEKPEDYLYSSARDYTEIKGLLDIKLY
jgi:putative transposase